jgi:hypothetical protein
MFSAGRIWFTLAYAKSWFGLASLKGSQDAAHAIIRQGLSPSLSNITAKFEALKKKTRDGEQLRYAMQILSSHAALSAVDNGEPDFTRWGEAERNREIILVSWDARNPASAYFASAIHASLISFARLESIHGRRGKHRVIIADEMPNLISLQHAQSLAMDRKEGISHHLLAQSKAQLDLVDPNLASIVIDQCQFELHFAVRFDDQERVQSFSKMDMAQLKSRTIGPQGLSVSEREYLDRILNLNKILEMSGTGGAGLFIRKVKDKYREPFLLWFEYQLSHECFRYLSSLPLPLKPKPAAPVKAALDPAWVARNAAIGALIDARAAYERGE